MIPLSTDDLPWFCDDGDRALRLWQARDVVEHRFVSFRGFRWADFAVHGGLQLGLAGDRLLGHSVDQGSAVQYEMQTHRLAIDKRTDDVGTCRAVCCAPCKHGADLSEIDRSSLHIGKDHCVHLA